MYTTKTSTVVDGHLKNPDKGYGSRLSKQDNDVKKKPWHSNFDSTRDGCYGCNSRNHKWADCKFNPKNEWANSTKSTGNSKSFDRTKKGVGLALAQCQNAGCEDSENPVKVGSTCYFADFKSNQCTDDENKLADASADCAQAPLVRGTIPDYLKDGKIELANGQEIKLVTGACNAHNITKDCESMPVVKGKLNAHVVDTLRDTGCSGVVVKRSLVSNEMLTGESHICFLIDGTARRFPVAVVHICTPYLCGEVKAMCMEKPVYDLIIGNVAGARDPSDPDANWMIHSKQCKGQTGVNIEIESDECSKRDNGSADQSGHERTIEVDCSDSVVVDLVDRSKADEPMTEHCESDTVEGAHAVTTRAQTEKKSRPIVPLIVNETSQNPVSSDEFLREQKHDPQLCKLFEKARSGKKATIRGRYQERFEVRRKLLYRIFMVKGRDPVKQLVVPQKLRTRVMSVAHESVLAGHLRIRKTIDRVGSCFYWPGMTGDVTRFCQSCDVCQRTVIKGSVKKVPLQSIPVVSEAFSKIGVDLVGPIYPPTENGNQYILTCMDYATRYPEAIALRTI